MSSDATPTRPTPRAPGTLVRFRDLDRGLDAARPAGANNMVVLAAGATSPLLGQTYDFRGSASGTGGSAIPAKIVSYDGTLYTIALYANGKTAASTGSARLELIQIHFQDQLPINTWLIVYSTLFYAVPG